MLEIKKSPKNAKIPEKIKVTNDMNVTKFGLSLNNIDARNIGKDTILININRGLNISRLLISGG
tara:strand:- start:1635 stop:1826 length:192 start_codon:yes stop_codon:yes gene_type:complete